MTPGGTRCSLLARNSDRCEASGSGRTRPSARPWLFVRSEMAEATVWQKQADDCRWLVIEKAALLYESSLASSMAERHLAAIDRVHAANKDGYCLADLARLSQLFTVLADYVHEHVAARILKATTELLRCRKRSGLRKQPSGA